ncbi:MAG: phasin family protein [Rhodoplanes sp.]
MPLAPVTREQFEVRSELEVVHLPTGAVFRAHPYSHPGDMLGSVKVYWNDSSGPPEGPGDYADEVQRVASQLLLERAVEDRRSGMRFENTGLDESDERDEREHTAGLETADEMRAVAERNVEQAKLAFDNYLRLTEKAVFALKKQFRIDQRGALDIAKQAIGFASNNVLSTFELAQQIIRTNDIQEMVRMQNLFIQSQMQVLGEQVKNLGDTIDKTAANAFDDVAPPLNPQERDQNLRK